MEQPYFYTENLAVGYHKKVLVGGIGISVRRGEIVTLIGPNGAGKSTVLKTAARQLEAVSGTVFLDGMRLDRLGGRELAKKVSILMTQRISPELMTCRDIVESGRYPYTGQMGFLSKADREKVTEAMALTSVTGIADRSFDQISDGQRQRVMLARAICQEPEILVLDEPTSYLDIRHKLELLGILKKLVREKQLAVLMSLHELELAQRISDYVVCIRDHKIERCGPPEEIFTDETISELYGITEGAYSACYGSVELGRCAGEPQVFVIAGNGTGCHEFRRLQKQDIPFATGILFQNDIDCPAARALAAETLIAPPFQPVDDRLFFRAKTVMDRCKRVVCTLDSFGEFNVENKRLLEYARVRGKV